MLTQNGAIDPNKDDFYRFPLNSQQNVDDLGCKMLSSQVRFRKVMKMISELQYNRIVQQLMLVFSARQSEGESKLEMWSIESHVKPAAAAVAQYSHFIGREIMNYVFLLVPVSNGQCVLVVLPRDVVVNLWYQKVNCKIVGLIFRIESYVTSSHTYYTHIFCKYTILSAMHVD